MDHIAVLAARDDRDVVIAPDGSQLPQRPGEEIPGADRVESLFARPGRDVGNVQVELVHVDGDEHDLRRVGPQFAVRGDELA